MISIKDYFLEKSLYDECINNINESNDIIELPYTFDIYNEGPKNKDFKITKANIYKIYFKISKNDNYDQMIRLPLPADKISYKYFPNKENTKNWTEVPEVQEYVSAGAWYSGKFVEYNYDKYNRDWNNWFKMIKPYMKGKISVTVQQGFNKNATSKYLVFSINNAQFNKEREEKIKELEDPNNLKKWAEEADKKEKERIEQQRKEEEQKKIAAEKWDKWWNSLSDDEKLRWSMGYDRGSGNFTGD